MAIPFRYGPAGGAPLESIGWTRSLSEGGATVEVPKRLGPQAALRLLLHMPRGQLGARGRVTWSQREAAGPGGAVAGLAFVAVDAPRLAALCAAELPLRLPRQDGIRFPLDVCAACHPLDSPLPRLDGQTGNASRHGLLLRLPRLVPPQQAAEVVLGAAADRLTIRGTIVWVEPPELWIPGRSIGHGFRFADADWPAVASLGSLLMGSA
jgi:hypothetical protein